MNLCDGTAIRNASLGDSLIGTHEGLMLPWKALRIINSESRCFMGQRKTLGEIDPIDLPVSEYQPQQRIVVIASPLGYAVTLTEERFDRIAVQIGFDCGLRIGSEPNGRTATSRDV